MIPKSVIERFSLVDTGQGIAQAPNCMIYQFPHAFKEGLSVYLMDVDVSGLPLQEDSFLIYIKGGHTEAYMRNVQTIFLLDVAPDILYQVIENQFYRQLSIFSLN